jgi:hypothetical protein
MTERKPHPDNELIDDLTEAGTPGHQGRGGGDINTRVGTRAELNQAQQGEDDREPVVGQDNPAADEAKGEKTVGRLDPSRGGPRSNRSSSKPA